MATTTFSVAPSRINSNGKTSPGLNLPANTYKVQAQIVSPDWSTTTGTLEYRIDVLVGGSWIEAGSAQPFPIGTLDRHGNLPMISCGNDLLLQATQIRIWIHPSVTLSIGADITIFTDWVPGT